jgi:hypothetical protein
MGSTTHLINSILSFGIGLFFFVKRQDLFIKKPVSSIQFVFDKMGIKADPMKGVWIGEIISYILIVTFLIAGCIELYRFIFGEI